MAKKNRVLQTVTYVTNSETGESEVFAAGTPESDIPKAFLERINNESVWGDSGVDDDGEDEVMVEDYSSMSQKALVEIAKERGVEAASTKKEDLVDALTQDDQARISSTAQVDVEFQ